jgi:hypothetical protein
MFDQDVVEERKEGPLGEKEEAISTKSNHTCVEAGSILWYSYCLETIGTLRWKDNRNPFAKPLKFN